MLSDLQVELDQVSLSLGQRSLEDVSVLPQCIVGLPESGQLALFVLELQR